MTEEFIPTHEGWFWCVPIWAELPDNDIEGNVVLLTKYYIPSFFLDFFVFLDYIYGRFWEQVDEDFVYEGLALKLKPVKKKVVIK